MEESYYEDHARGAVEKMLNQIHIVGEGYELISFVLLVYVKFFSLSLSVCI